MVNAGENADSTPNIQRPMKSNHGDTEARRQGKRDCPLSSLLPPRWNVARIRRRAEVRPIARSGAHELLPCAEFEQRFAGRGHGLPSQAELVFSVPLCLRWWVFLLSVVAELTQHPTSNNQRPTKSNHGDTEARREGKSDCPPCSLLSPQWSVARIRHRAESRPVARSDAHGLLPCAEFAQRFAGRGHGLSVRAELVFSVPLYLRWWVFLLLLVAGLTQRPTLASWASVGFDTRRYFDVEPAVPGRWIKWKTLRPALIQRRSPPSPGHAVLHEGISTWTGPVE